jgi:hypothetical protein
MRDINYKNINKIIFISSLLSGLPLVATSQEVESNGSETKQPRPTFCVYTGAGQGGSSGNETNDFTPWSIGVYGGRDFMVGLDLSGEGTQEDSTYGYDSIEQGLSLNFLFGGNIISKGDFKVDCLILLGMIQTSTSCPEGDSYIGYQCYADSNASGEYDLNYGALLTASYKKAMVGMRVTGESVQALIGLRF